MADGQTSMDVQSDGGTPVIYLTGEFDLTTRPALVQELEQLQGGERRTVVLDLTATTFIDSTVINVLVAAHKQGLDLVIRGASGTPRHVLEVLGMFDVFGSED